MKLQFYSLYLVAVIYQSSEAQKEDDSNVQSTTVVYSVHDPVSKCSTHLSRTLSRLCDNDFKIIKRRDTSLLLGKLIPTELQEHMQRQNNLTYERWRRRRVRRQIVDECCIQPCTIGQLILYCPDESKLVKENPEIFYD